MIGRERRTTPTRAGIRVIAEVLAGKRLFITGSTGFLGTALVERLLRAVPDAHLTLLIRPGRRVSAAERARRELFRNDAFDALRASWDAAGVAADAERPGTGVEQAAPAGTARPRSRAGRASGGFDRELARRVDVVGGDVSVDGLGLDEAGRAALAAADVVIHSAAAVSFDSPLDAAVEINLLGPSRIAQTLTELGVAPHYLAVSTCYVAGSRRGNALEEPVDASPFYVQVDWRAEVAGARRARADADALSRSTEQLRRFRKQARAELGAAGGPLLAAKTEQLRQRWVDDRLITAGRERAASVGFPDAYAFTKALAEVALAETHGAVPTTILRPSIIESAMADPFPGWIRGFRMAEPVIISYARGLLRDFPGVPEGVVDVIPVDLVVGAIIAVAAQEAANPRPDPTVQPPVFQVASGGANPLRYRRLVDLVATWFGEHPLYDSLGQPIKTPQWSFPGRGRVEGQLRRTLGAITKVERTLNALPLRGKQAELAANLEEKRELAERAMGYVELYGKYAECEAIYGVNRLLALWDSLEDTDRERFCFDPRIIEWERYVRDTHLPSVVRNARARTSPGTRGGETRSERLRRQVLAPERQFAAFDLENTLIASNVVASYAWLASRRLSRGERLRFVAKTLAEGPSLLRLDKADRSDFLRFFYRRYEGAPVGLLAEDSAEMLSDLILSRSFPAAIRRVREHRAAGHRTVLITGALDFIIDPLRPLFDDIIAAEMSIDAGCYTGELLAAPPTGESRAQALFDYAAARGFDPAEGVAYADSTSDLPMLEAVGFPVAVNPETRLAALARKRGWLVEHFDRAPGYHHRLLPLAPTPLSAQR
ncbi:MAG: HAD-IB family hydrolase [Acidimicrobiales bacterium]